MLLKENLLFSSTLSTMPTIEWLPISGSFLPTPFPGRIGPFLICKFPILLCDPKHASIARQFPSGCFFFIDCKDSYIFKAWIGLSKVP